MKDEVPASGRRLAIQEGDTKIYEEPNTRIVDYINDFRCVSTGARFTFGIMTGNAFIDSEVSFIYLQSGSQIGEHDSQHIIPRSPRNFSAMTEKGAAAICKEIIARIHPRWARTVHNKRRDLTAKVREALDRE